MATALVVVKPHERLRLEQNRKDKETGDFPVTQLVPIDAPSRTYIEMIRSRLLAERVVHRLGLDRRNDPPLVSRWARLRQSGEDVLSDGWEFLQYGTVRPGDPVAKAVRRVQRKCTLAPAKDTYLFDITCGARSAEDAAAIANASAEVFIAYAAGVNRQESGGNRMFLEQRLHDSEAVLADARRALTAFKDRQGTFSLQEEDAQQLKTISGLETELEKTDARLAGLLNEYTRDHPKVMSLVAETERLRQSLARLRQQRTVLPDKEKQLEDLRLRVKVAEDTYTVVTKALAETRIQEQSQVSEIRVVSPAAPPAYPTRPIRVYYVAGAVVAAMLVGVAAVLYAESVWPRLRSTADVERLGLPVLATIPRAGWRVWRRVG
ncbi:MAG: hypothetical protein DMD81_24940 [Candidatus Rokuibacteriota bacterium]|nr:MAG: hypothetical protein DMD81_24940 [Candidatus Rokubacteria bacterium]